MNKPNASADSNPANQAGISQMSKNPVAWFGGFGVVAISLYLLWIGQNILQPLFVAAFLVLVLNGIANFLMRIKLFGFSLPYFAAYSLALILILLGLVMMMEIIIGNVAKINDNIGIYQSNLKALIERYSSLFAALELPSFQEFLSQLSLRSLFTQSVSSVTGITGNIFTVILFMVFILLERTSIKGKLHHLAKNTDDEMAMRHSVAYVSKMLENYIGTKALVSCVTALCSYGLMLVVGLDYPGFWAMLIFILNFIPYIGSLIAILFPISLSVLQFASPFPILVTAAGLLIIQVSFGNFIEPRVMGKSLNISPLVLLLSLATFGSIWGIVGMVLAVPLTVIAMVISAQYPSTRLLAIMISANGAVDHLHKGAAKDVDK
ncbi:MAG: AI-2E family transporter [Alphaproteobacteria bacterium]